MKKLNKKTKQPLVDVKKLINETDGGKEIYLMVMPNLEEETECRFKETLNPFYDDTNPGLSIYKDNDEWKHFDHGDETFCGNAIDIAALHYELDRKTQFKELLSNIVNDLKIDPELVKIDNFYKVPAIEEWWNDVEGIEIALGYFKKYGITKDVLKKYSVRAVKYWSYVDENGEYKKQFVNNDDLVIAYEDINHTKFYSPYAEKEKKFRYTGVKSKEFVFGECQLLSKSALENTDFDGTPLIITGGEKDVLTLASLGYHAICLNSETATIPKHLDNTLFVLYEKVIMLYDIDETGKRNASKLASKYNFCVCTLPETLNEKGGKDVSDYVKFGFSINELRTLIKSSSQITNAPDETNPEKEETTCSSKETTAARAANKPDNILASTGSNTPTFPAEVYKLLPEMLSNICKNFDDQREKDVLLLSCITVISTCIPQIRGIYGDKSLGCNINTFISAPASAGKGVMSWAWYLASDINKHLKEKFKEEYNKYHSELAKYHKDGGERPIMPKEARLFIPANSSSSSIIELLDANQNFGIIFDNEGDTMSSVMKNDWGDYSSIIRKAFAHEYISLARRGNNEFREVEKPHLSVLLSGTRNQIKNLIDSVENGLFSRFAFYDFDIELEWKNMFERNNSGMEGYFKKHGKQLLENWLTQKQGGERFFYLTDDQQECITGLFADKMKEMFGKFGDGILPSIRRYCIILYRIAMVLESFRYFQLKDNSLKQMRERWYIDDNNIICAFLIMETLLTHLEVVFSRMVNGSNTSNLNNHQIALYTALPQNFTWSEFKTIGAGLGINEDTIQKYRRDLLKAKLMTSPERGKYEKC